MSWRIIDVAQDGRYLHTDRDWLVIAHKSEEIGRVPLIDIQSILVHARHASYSHGLMLRLSEHNIPLVICDHRHEPVSILLSLTGHHRHAGRTQAQAQCSQPLRKRIWRDLVRAKIMEQGRSLAPFDPIGCEGLLKLAASVRAGDPVNVEARAARYYWPRLFGKSFRRDRDCVGLNAHLNYGYTILRSALARATTAAGLTPSLGVGHVNARNSFCLVDDLMEPFRPLADREVWKNRAVWNDVIMPAARAELAAMMTRSVMTDDGETDLFRTMTLVVSSLVKAYDGEAKSIYLPNSLAFVDAPLLPGVQALGR